IDVFQQIAPRFGAGQLSHYAVCGFGLECGCQRAVSLNLIFQLPQLTDGVPVSIVVRNQDAPDERSVLHADKLREHLLESNSRLKLSQVQDPMQAEVPLLNVESVFQQNHQLRQRACLHGIAIQKLEVTQNLRQIA